MPVPLHCINEAATEYHIPAQLLIAILQTERGKIGQIVKNKNGSYDIGPSQINSSWLPELKAHGISQEQLQYDPCINIKVGAWITAKAIAHEKNLFAGIGDYHSHTKTYNQSYLQKIRIHFTKLHFLLGE
jgi:soluble lytic murein transglycosylase-like protein